MNYYETIIPSKSYFDFIIPFISIPIMDRILCIMFGTKSRWFQLHSLVNGIVVYIIWTDVINLFIDPLGNIRDSYSYIDRYFIIILHIYHMIVFKQLTRLDYFHHILFIGFGILPSLYFYNSNLIRLAFFPTCGLPGCIEYLTLSLVKHKKMEFLHL